jgi:hypothetical protein
MRVQLELTDETVRNVKALMEDTGTETYKELFNNALTILDWAVQEVREGNIIAAVDKREDRYKEFVTPILRFVAARARDQEESEALVGAGTAH